MAQTKVVKSIRSFGATGNGKTNDTEAFLKAAAFFNARGGNGTLLIPKGIYIVGKQIFSEGHVTKHAFSGANMLDFKNISNLLIKGSKGAEIKYADGLMFGSFDPVTAKSFDGNNPLQPDPKYAGEIGYCIGLNNCHNITIKTLSLNGNNKMAKWGGAYGDKGIQLMHTGIYIGNSHEVEIDNVTASYFALDGIIISNAVSSGQDNIHLLNATFEYNCRQGLSWVGGNYLLAENCKFNHSGRVTYCSPPGAGLDIEAEVAPVTNGIFKNCEFIDNTGCGMVTAGGPTSNCKFINCTFWGVSNWSVWVSAPGFSFNRCKIFGSTIHGYGAKNSQDATSYISCYFEDKPYKNKPVYGKYMIESEGAYRILYDSCTIVNNTKSIAWLNTEGAKSPAEKARFQNSRIIINKKDSGMATVAFINIIFKNNTVEFKDPNAKQKKYWSAPCCLSPEDRDATKIIYDK